MDPLHAVFDTYKLDELDRSWINQVYESGFSNIDNVPVKYLVFLESPDMSELVKDSCSVVKNWMSENGDVRINDRDEVSWETLIAMELEVRALLAVLAYLMKKGQSFNASQASRQSCLRATSLYFVLLAIPGSNAFQAFQPNLYEIALRSLEMSRYLAAGEKTASRPSLEDSEDPQSDEENLEFSFGLSRSQTLTLTRGLNAVMYDLVIMLKSTCTSMEIRSVEITIYYLVEITKLADESINSHRSNQATTSSLAYNAYVALEQVCNSKYASISAIARLIAKYALPQFIVSGTKLPVKQSAIVRESTLCFLKNLLDSHGKDVQAALIILIQHAMFKCPERLDGRQKQAAIIVKLLNICCRDKASLKECIRDIVRLSHHSKISCRIFAQEIIGKFLMELSSAKSHRNNDILSSDLMEEILLADVLGRCVDSSSMVRGRAIATLAEYTDSVNKPEVIKLFQARRESVDRELSSLEKMEEIIENENIDTLLPNSNELMAMLKDRLEDERALVRRSALQVLHNGVLISEKLLDIAVPIIRQHCRDSVLTVRRYAIRVLTNLFETFPEKAGLCEHWVDSVIPRIFDGETRVQEEVLDSLEKMTFAKIKHYELETETSSLPWRILEKIATSKMGDHLSKACSIWIEANRITETKISIIKSHIGTCNNMGAWFLLASISENKRLSRMEIHYASLGITVFESADRDVFLASLALRVLKNSWSTFSDLTLQRISRDLTNYLLKYRVEVSLIRLCLDILLDVARYLETINADSENRAQQQSCEITRELTELSEATIRRMVDSGSGEYTSNLLFRAVCTLGHSSFLSWRQISKDVRRILQRFLLEWNSLPDSVTVAKELQGAAVTVLGQQALIDRDIAVEMTPIFGCLLCNKSTILRRKKRIDSGGESCVVASSLKTSDRMDYEDMANGPVVRINAAKALADICARFTALVEPYLPDMCISMKDPNPEVRQVILVIFIQLLVEDTIMIKQAFFFHILTMLADEDATIRQMTIFLVKERLLAKNKNLITQQLLNGIYHFNDYERRTSVVNRRRKVRDRGALSLAGRENAKSRRIIYDFMLENLDPPGKLTIIVKLTSHILDPRRNDSLDVGCEKGISVIRDALYILSSDHLQPNSCSKQIIDDDNADEAGNCPASSVIVEAMKKHRNQIFLPCLVELKIRCEELKSPVAADVAKVLVQAVADSSKEALTSLYNEYPKLERELQRDSRKYCKRSSDDFAEPDDETSHCQTRKKSTPEKHSLLLNPDRMPRIILRRLSTLTYPTTSAFGATSSGTNSHTEASDCSTISNSTTRKRSSGDLARDYTEVFQSLTACNSDVRSRTMIEARRVRCSE